MNRSEYDFCGHDRALRAGFATVRGLSERSIGALLAARRGGHFLSLRDLISRVDLSERELTALIKVGALDGIARGATRRQLLWQMKTWRATGSLARETRQPGLPLDGLLLPDLDGLPATPDYNAEQRAEIEQHYLGFTLATRPLEFYAAELAKYKPLASTELQEHSGESVVLAGRPIAGRRHITRAGEWLLFLSLEDDYGIMELVLFPKVYRQYATEIRQGGPFVVRGRVDSQRSGELTIVVEKIRHCGK